MFPIGNIPLLTNIRLVEPFGRPSHDLTDSSDARISTDLLLTLKSELVSFVTCSPDDSSLLHSIQPIYNRVKLLNFRSR